MKSVIAVALFLFFAGAALWLASVLLEHPSEFISFSGRYGMLACLPFMLASLVALYRHKKNAK